MILTIKKLAKAVKRIEETNDVDMVADELGVTGQHLALRLRELGFKYKKARLSRNKTTGSAQPSSMDKNEKRDAGKWAKVLGR